MSKCSFCNADQVARLTTIANGKIETVYFCPDHKISYGVRGYRFQVSSEGPSKEDVELDEMVNDTLSSVCLNRQGCSHGQNISDGDVLAVLEVYSDIARRPLPLGRERGQDETDLDATISLLKNRMDGVKKKENFKEAAEIRDRIQKLKNERR